VPGARPPKASDARVLTVADILSGLIGDGVAPSTAKDASHPAATCAMWIRCKHFLR